MLPAPYASPEPAADGGGLRVALLTPGPVSDQPWNAEEYAGLLAIRDSLGATVSRIQTRTAAESGENFRAHERKGCHVVVRHGFEFQALAHRRLPASTRERVDSARHAMQRGTWQGAAPDTSY